jgi:hypothetical protein
VQGGNTTSGAGGRATITACIIARDEAVNLPDCLASVAFCSEIVLVDSGSTDATIELALAAGARVVEESWRGYAGQRNVALDHAHGEWVLEIDADERVSPALRGEIEAFLDTPPEDSSLCGLPLREMFLGHALGPAGKYPKYRHRLLRRGAYRHDESRTVHEGLVPDGIVHPFAGELVHLLAVSWREALGDAWRYARLEAGQLRARRSATAALKGVIVRPSIKFVYRLSIDGGWRDGWAGVAKIALDCATDSVVWVRYMTGAHGQERGDSGVDPTLHYGAWKIHRGSLRVVGIAAGRSSRAQAMSWLARAAAAGADVALLISDRVDVDPNEAPPVGESSVRVRPLTRFGPLSLIRALDAEEQLRTIDAVIPFGTLSSVLLRAVPSSLRGERTDLTPASDPTAIAWGAEARGERPG